MGDLAIFSDLSMLKKESLTKFVVTEIWVVFGTHTSKFGDIKLKFQVVFLNCSYFLRS